MGARVTWLAMGVRPLWYASILIWAAVQPIEMWERGIVTVFGIIYAATNMVLLTRNDNPSWSNVIDKTLTVELATSILAALWLSPLLPEGPLPLVLWPTLTTLMVRNDKASFRMAIGMAAVVSSFVLDFPVLSNGLPFGLPPVAIGHRTTSAGIGGLTGVGGTSGINNATGVGGAPAVVGIAADGRWAALLFGLYLTLGLSLFVVAFLLRQHAQQTRQLQFTMDELKQKSEELSRRNQQLNEFSDKVYELAATEERNRIASEIHDTVAHRLTALFVQLQAARRRLTSGELEGAVENLEVSEALTQESLEAVRQSVRRIRRTSANEGIGALRRLITQYASLTGMTITTVFEASLQGTPPVVLALLYRVIQEALTNAKRHGRASEVTVQLTRIGLTLHLLVRDNGRGASEPKDGFGLSTMRDRVENLGGQITIETQPGKGFALSLRIPAWEA
ncbi:sensor histidine kinase [Alicyclobacillus curvatus]|nr:sensor histidine kinase [Alicyclobacillus curvatus]